MTIRITIDAPLAVACWPRTGTPSKTDVPVGGVIFKDADPLPNATLKVWLGLVFFQNQLSNPPSATVVSDSNGNFNTTVSMVVPCGDLVGICVGYNATSPSDPNGIFGFVLTQGIQGTPPVPPIIVVPPSQIVSGPSAVGSWLVSKKLQYVEESSYGVLPSSPAYQAIAYDSQVLISIPTALAPLLQPNSEDPQTFTKQKIDQYNIDLVYRPYDTVFAQYGFNAQGGGSGTVDKSLSLAMSVLLQGTSEYFFQPVGCRVESVRIGGRAGGPITVRCRVASQLIETASTTVPSGLFALNPQNIPLMFKDGGPQPVTIDGNPYNVNSIQVEASRNLDRVPMPNSTVAQTIIPRTRTITGTIGIVSMNTDNYARLRGDKAFTLNWTLKGSALTLYGCRFKALSNLRIVQGSTIYETYRFEALQGVLS